MRQLEPTEACHAQFHEDVRLPALMQYALVVPHDHGAVDARLAHLLDAAHGLDLALIGHVHRKLEDLQADLGAVKDGRMMLPGRGVKSGSVDNVETPEVGR